MTFQAAGRSKVSFIKQMNDISEYRSRQSVIHKTTRAYFRKDSVKISQKTKAAL
jgi:hypothetical protein